MMHVTRSIESPKDLSDMHPYATAHAARNMQDSYFLGFQVGGKIRSRSLSIISRRNLRDGDGCGITILLECRNSGACFFIGKYFRNTRLCVLLDENKLNSSVLLSRAMANRSWQNCLGLSEMTFSTLRRR